MICKCGIYRLPLYFNYNLVFILIIFRISITSAITMHPFISRSLSINDKLVGDNLKYILLNKTFTYSKQHQCCLNKEMV